MIVISGATPYNADLVLAATSDYASPTWVWEPSPAPVTAPGTPVDLTNYTAVAIVYANLDDASPLITVTDASSASGQVVLGGAAGTVQLAFTHATTSALPSIPLRLTVRLTAPSPASTQTVLLTGTIRRLPVGPLT